MLETINGFDVLLVMIIAGFWVRNRVLNYEVNQRVLEIMRHKCNTNQSGGQL